MPTPPAPPLRPNGRARLAFFAVGAILGGFVGWSFVASGPEEARSLLQSRSLAWVVGLALLFGGVAALSALRVIRRGHLRTRDECRD